MGINSNLRCSLKGQQLIKDFEGLRLKAYTDSIGVWTIGWGHTGSVYRGQVITHPRAQTLFESDLRVKAETQVDHFISIRLTQDQFDALCSFTFNAGSGSLQKSGIRREINKENFQLAHDLWLSQNTLKGNKGLRKRRRKEASLFLNGSSVVSTRISKLIKPVVTENIVKKRFIEYIHTGGSYTIDELLTQDTFLVQEKHLSKKDLLSISFQGKTNHERLFDSLNREERELYSSVYKKEIDYPVTNGAILIIPNNKVDIGISFDSNFSTSQSEYSQFFPGIAKAISNDPGNKTKLTSISEDYLRKQNSVISVWAWSRRLYLQGENLGYIDLTKYISSAVTSNTTSNGSNFSIELSPVYGRFIDGEWRKAGITSVDGGSQEITQTPLNYFDGKTRRRSNFYFKEILGENDLVFISFEQLEIEKDRDGIARGWYDMIGMIDSIQLSPSASHEVGISVQGKSLDKVLHNDNSYFNPYSVNHSSSIFGKTPLSNERFLDGRFHNLESILNRSIEQSIRFIFHRISSLNYTPSDIFGSFEDLTTVSKTISAAVDGIEESEKYELYKNVHRDTRKELRGVWQIIKLFVDQSVRDLRVVDDSISNPNGSVYDLVKKICQEPFVEFFSDSYGDKFYLIIRKPPFNQEAILDAMVSDEVDKSFEKYVSRIKSRQKDEVELFYTADNSISNLESVSFSNMPKLVTISEESVIGDNLAHSSESYAWFQLTDRGNYAGGSVDHGVYPGVYFDEMAQVYGNNRMSVVSNYSNQDFWTDLSEQSRIDKYAKHASELLGWVIETHIHLPFTRTGSITIQGDRRIKAGTYIHYLPTDEIFYVKGVTQQISVGSKIDRVTQLTVERGMVRRYINDGQVSPSGQVLSYFNLVDIDSFKDSYYKIVAEGGTQKFDYKSGLSINKEVFDFFLRNKQFKDSH